MAGTPVLRGIRVIDFGQYIAGPVAAMLLADHGADVIRVDPPGGPPFDTPANATWNRGKRSIVLDLKTGEARQTAQRLVAGADVVIENFRPGVMDRLGLGPAAMSALHPRLIYCSLPGFAADDPRAGMRAWEGILGAATAAYRPKNGKPVYTVLPYSSMFGAFLAVVSITLALNARERSGRGQSIEIPLFDATFTALSNHVLRVHGGSTPANFEWSRLLPTRDGRWMRYYSINKCSAAFLRELGLEQLREQGRAAAELGRRFEEIFRSRSAAEWEDICANNGTECATCLSSAEWLEHPHALQSGIVADFDDPVLGRFRGVGINVRLAETPGAVLRPRPVPDADRTAILEECADGPQQIPPSQGIELRRALDGLKVIDLCIVLAGPTCGRTLAEFGADVIKIDSPHTNPVQLHNDVNRGKRSILLDLKTTEGKAIFWRLLEQADVLLENFRPGVAESLGVAYTQIRQRRPDIVYCRLNAFGQTGSLADRPGHESIAQAVTGMMLRYGGGKPALAPFSANDYGTGLLGCYGVALALLHRRRTGIGQQVDSALVYTATLLQSGVAQDYAGKQWNEPGGQDTLGHGALYRLYQARDGWFFLATRAEKLADCPALADIASLAQAQIERSLERRFATRGVAQWVETLNAAGIAAHRAVESVDELAKDPWVRAHGLVITRDHERLGPVTTTGPGPRLSRTPLQAGGPASRPGADARSVLQEIGLGGELERLVRERVVFLEGVVAG